MKKPIFAALSLLFALASSNAWSELKIGEFVLGTKKSEVMQLLEQRFQAIAPTTGNRYQVPVEFYSATTPVNDYLLGGIRVSKVNVFFNETNHLSQVELVLDTVQLEKARALIPDVERSQLEPVFKDSWEILFNDGEIVYFVGSLSGTTQISMADKATSSKNIEARRRSNLRFKGLSDKMDHLIDTMKNQQGTASK